MPVFTRRGQQHSIFSIFEYSQPVGAKNLDTVKHIRKRDVIECVLRITQYGRGRRNSGWRNTHGRFYYSLIVSVYTCREQEKQVMMFSAGHCSPTGKADTTINEIETESKQHSSNSSGVSHGLYASVNFDMMVFHIYARYPISK